MKRLLAAVVALVLLTGCTGSTSALEKVMALRADLLAADCGFHAVITADYGDEVHTFAMDCTFGTDGDLTFTVAEPESITGIAGKVSREGGALTFDDSVLAFPLLADDQFSPVSGPWVLMQTLRGGYVTACGEEEGLIRATIRDTYEDDALQLDIRLDENGLPSEGEVFWEGRRVLTVKVENFRYL